MKNLNNLKNITIEKIEHLKKLNNWKNWTFEKIKQLKKMERLKNKNKSLKLNWTISVENGHSNTLIEQPTYGDP